MKRDYICKSCNKPFSRDDCGKNPTFCCLDCYKEYRNKNKVDYQQYKKDYGKDYYKKNKESIAKKGKEYRKRTREIWREKWKLKGKTLGTRYGVYKSTAKRRNIDFNITKEEFKKLWNKPCYYCGSEIVGIGVDRLDNTKGYQVDNIVPCCAWCNKMKLNYTKEEFINHCEKIVNFNK
jgi:hypothetical protein